ncbi:MAG: hypothetical protein QM796_18390 [Chthoniobacteraceae bacterium]
MSSAIQYLCSFSFFPHVSLALSSFRCKPMMFLLLKLRCWLARRHLYAALRHRPKLRKAQ